MNINWRVRLKNKPFLLSFCTTVLTFVYSILSVFGIVPSITQTMAGDLITALIGILVAVGIVVDPTTTRVTDSAQALTYTEPKR